MDIHLGTSADGSVKEHLEPVTKSVADMLLVLSGLDEIGVTDSNRT
jgi:hypothetical protein